MMIILQLNTVLSLLAYNLIDLITNDVTHLLFLFVDLDFDLPSKFLLLESIEVTDNFKSWLQDNCGNKSPKATDHMNNTSTYKVNKTKLFEPSFTPNP